MYAGMRSRASNATADGLSAPRSCRHVLRQVAPIVAACAAVIEGRKYLDRLGDIPQAEFNAAQDVVEMQRQWIWEQVSSSLADIQAKARLIMTERRKGWSESEEFLVAFLSDVIALKS